MMNRKKRTESSSSSGGYEESRSYDDGTKKGKRALVDHPGESKQNNAQPEEISGAAAAQLSMKPSKNDQDKHRSLTKLPPPMSTNTSTTGNTDRQSSLVAVALAEERDRKMPAVPRWSTTNAAAGTTTMIATLQPPPPSLPSNPPQLQSRGLSGSGAEAPLQLPRQIPSVLNQERFADVRLQQQLLLYQQQQQQERERLLRQNLLSFNPQGLIHHLNFQSNLQQQLSMNERLQQHASAIPHLQSYNNNFAAGMFRQLQMEQIDEQVRQRQLMELALLQNQQRHLWTTVNNERHSIIPTIPNQTSQQSTTDMDDAVAATLSTDSTTATSHLNNNIVEENNATIDSALKKYLLVTTTVARPPKKKPEHTGKDTKSSKSKSSKMDDDAPLEYTFEPENMKELSLPTDTENLSEYQCLLRQQIVLFTVGAADIQCSAQGRNKPIVLGQVGTLCRHCAKIKPGLRPSGAVYFPAKLTGLYQASQNMAINHFSNNCQSIPEPLRQKLMQLKEQKSTVLGGGKLFWANCAKAIGVVEHEDQLRFEEKSDTTGGTES